MEGLGAATRLWVEKQLALGRRITGVERLRGGWTSEMRRIDLDGSPAVVLRSFVHPFYRRHAEGLLNREAGILQLLEATDVPTARLVAVDATGSECDDPSLLMTLLPGRLRLGDDGADERIELLARQLAAIHRVAPAERPRDYQAWSAPDRVRVPEATERPEVWQAAVDGIRREPPPYRGCFLHRDFHPGNVLYGPTGITGVVDWVETSWGPADLDVAHCSTALALLHGPDIGLRFAERYAAAGGRTLAEPEDHLYWRLLDALGYAPDAEKVADPWRQVGRSDLTPAVLQERLEIYLQRVLGLE
jgi:aminoglycoside phosphotransferase (APT) family kinase protein